MQKVEPSADGATAVITLNYIPSPFYVGEQWMIWIGPGPIWLDAGYGDDGTTTFRNLHYYGGADNYAMGDVSGSGKLIFDKLYCGPPAYQPDRMLTCDEGWQGGGRYAFTVTDSTFLKTWDDVFDFGSGDTTALSQPAPNQVVIAGTGDYRVGDLTELADDTTAADRNLRQVGNHGGLDGERQNDDYAQRCMSRSITPAKTGLPTSRRPGRSRPSMTRSTAPWSATSTGAAGRASW